MTFRQNCQARVPRVPAVPMGMGTLPPAPTASLAAANPKCRNSGNCHLHFKQQFQARPTPNQFGFLGSVFIGADPSHHRVSRNEPFFSVIGLQ